LAAALAEAAADEALAALELEEEDRSVDRFEGSNVDWDMTCTRDRAAKARS